MNYKAWSSWIPDSNFGKKFSALLLVFFFALPLLKINDRLLKPLSKLLLPHSVDFPSYFSTKIDVFAGELLILIMAGLIYKIGYKRLLWDGPAKYLSLFMAAALCSVAFSNYANLSLQYAIVLSFSLSFLFFDLIVRGLNPAQFKYWIKVFAWGLLFISLVECAIGIAQYFKQGAIGLKFLGESSLKMLYITNPTGGRWALDALFGIKSTSPFLFRSAGTFGHANIFGGFLFLSILNTFYLYFSGKKRLFLSFVLFVQAATLCTTYSRSAILALAVVCPILFILAWKQLKNTPAARSVIVLMATLGICAAALLALLYPQFAARGGIVNYHAGVLGADKERLLYQDIAWNMLKDNPLFGVGFNNFQLAVNQYLPPDAQNTLAFKVHNIFLLVASETGLIGLSLFLLFLYSILRKVFASPWNLEKIFLVSVFFGFLLIGLCDMYFICNVKARFLFFGVAALLYCSSDQEIGNLITP